MTLIIPLVTRLLQVLPKVDETAPCLWMNLACPNGDTFRRPSQHQHTNAPTHKPRTQTRAKAHPAHPPSSMSSSLLICRPHHPRPHARHPHSIRCMRAVGITRPITFLDQQVFVEHHLHHFCPSRVQGRTIIILMVAAVAIAKGRGNLTLPLSLLHLPLRHRTPPRKKILYLLYINRHSYLLRAQDKQIGSRLYPQQQTTSNCGSCLIRRICWEKGGMQRFIWQRISGRKS